MIHIKYAGNFISISGHANYSDGEDIVCASVSSIMYTTVNALLKFDDKSIKYSDDGNKVVIEILNDTNETKILIDNMISLFLELSSQYKKNIKIEMEE